MPTRTVPACAVALIQRFEGLHDGDKKTPNILEPQADPIGIYTVGWGYALFQDGKPVKDKATALKMWRERWPNGMTRADADKLLVQVAQEVTDKVMRLVGDKPIRDGELGAMVSLAYNIGVGQKGGAADHLHCCSDRRRQGLWNVTRPTRLHTSAPLASAGGAFCRFGIALRYPWIGRRRHPRPGLPLDRAAPRAWAPQLLPDLGDPGELPTPPARLEARDHRL